MTELSSQYNPKDVEERLYQSWESQGLFQAEVDPSGKCKPYTIVIPPPNVTGILHMGHALNNTIQDILIRCKRMQGSNALWIPGTDHAGIATQNVVEKMLAKEGKRRQDLGREAFIERVWQWRERYGKTIINQLKRLGSSCDWNRTRFTMDEGLSEAVAEVFIRLYKKGLIYRGHYIINWCPRCQTALSDEEAPRQETQGKLYYIKYPLVTSDQWSVTSEKQQSLASHQSLVTSHCIEVATTRPETMLGDTAIAVHPKDKRYKALIGGFAMLPLVKRRLPIIADQVVDRSFGTGAVKVTPAHDPADFQLGRKHTLEFINVMTDDARIVGNIPDIPEVYRRLDRFECRSKLIVDLEREGFLGKIEEHIHNVGHCYRCQTVIEPRLSPQWFVKMKPLAKPAIRAVKEGKIRFSPKRWTKVYLNWMENIQDWCISRQIWWGHRLPVYYCKNCQKRGTVPSPNSEFGVRSSELNLSQKAIPHSALRTPHSLGVIVSKTKPERCPSCESTDLTQDEDVLDTWFSSWLWPFSTLGWPKKSKDLAYFYPTDALVTAQEIIFFWVARMIMAGYFCMKQPPFRQVYIHGTVRDITGKKMSKSLGNIIDPLEMIDRFGTDALRYTLITSTAIGQDIFLSEERFVAGRNFANKLWNATRFVLSTVENSEFGVRSSEWEDLFRTPHSALRTPHLSVVDRWILSRLQETIQRVSRSLDGLSFNDAANTLYDFLWHDFCDWYLEASKVQLTQDEHQNMESRVFSNSELGMRSAESKAFHSELRTPHSESRMILVHVLETSLRLLHPIMPFVTEELWQHLQQVRSAECGVRNETPNSELRTPNSESRTPNSIMTAPWPKASKTLIDPEAEQAFEQLRTIITAIRNLRAELNVPQASQPRILLGSKISSARQLFEEHRILIQALGNTGGISVDTTIPSTSHAAVVIVDGIQVLMPLQGLIDLQQEHARIKRRVEELNGESSRLKQRLQNHEFTKKAPPEVIEQTRERHDQILKTLKHLSEHLDALKTT